MDICVIQVPYMSGDERHPASRGPGRYLRAGAEKLLAATGGSLDVERVERPRSMETMGAGPAASFAVNAVLADVVRRAYGSGRRPLILAGSCDASIGTLAGIDHTGWGVVWIDAHGDFNTPDSTVSGFFPGMSVAVVTGHCHQDLWVQIGGTRAVPEAATLMIGVRDLSPEGERVRLEDSEIRVVRWHDGKAGSDVGVALDELATRVRDVYLHIDCDALDPTVAPGVTDRPAPGGLSLQQMEETIGAVAARFRIGSAALTNYNPDHDRKDRTLYAGLRILEVLGESWSASG